MNTDIAKPIVERLAARLAASWPGIEREDIAQEMFSKLLSQWSTIEAQPEGDWPKLITYRARQAGVHYCQTERHHYQARTTEWIYTPSEIRRVFAEHYFTPGAWLDAPKRPEWGEQTLKGDGLCVVLWDVQKGYESLSEQDQTIIMRAYQCHETLTTSAEKMRLSRAIDRVTHAMNNGVAKRFDHSDHDGPGSRAIVSNAQARAATTNDYDN